MRILDFIEKYAAAFQTILAVIAVGWSIWWWFWGRERKPKAKIDLGLEHVELENGKDLLRVVINVENVGRILLKTDDVTIYIQQIAPIPMIDGKPFTFELCSDQYEYKWPCLITNSGCPKPYIFEPGESGSMIFERVIDRTELPRAVSVYVHIGNPSVGKTVGWDLSKIFRIKI